MVPLHWIFPSTFILTTLLVISSSPPMAESQMVPVSEVITHDLSKEKSKVHAKIAEKHLESKERDGDDEKVTRKDKPDEFRDPARHASESSLLHFLLEQYKLSGEDTEQKTEILENLLHFSNKFENGRDLFGATDALQAILLPALNSSSLEIRLKACSIFGVAGQNNGIVQSKSVEGGVVRHLIHLVTFDREVHPKALFALASLLRNYPDGQKQLIKLGGIPEIVKVSFYPETRRRGITFLLDLLSERRLCDPSNIPHDKGDYPELSSDDPCDEFHLLDNALLTGGWCELLEESVTSLLTFGTEDQMLIIEGVELSVRLCNLKLRNLSRVFSQLLDKFNSDSDYEGTLKQLENILALISSPTPPLSTSRIEL